MSDIAILDTPTKLSHSAIRDYAEKIGRHHGIYDVSGCADVDALVHKLGGRVVVRDTAESMHVFGKSDFEIFLPTFTSARRDQFTKAHELGHYFIHYRHAGLDGPAKFGRGGQNLAETQANVFASSLLMPEREYRTAFARYGDDWWALARHFNVSPAAAEVRARVLNLT
jgi:Zn-dependent peptidase ImmA (M78 family)